MKNICNFRASKYASPAYIEVEPDIYQCEGGFVTSLSFEQEPEFGEDSAANQIAQYPMEDILDRFCVHISDYYNDLHADGQGLCYLEFCGRSIRSVKELRSIIGKHVYNRTVRGAGAEYIDLVIE